MYGSTTRALPIPASGNGALFPELEGSDRVLVPLRLQHPTGELAFFSTVTTFGTAFDVTLAELAIEAFYPADPHTATGLPSAR